MQSLHCLSALFLSFPFGEEEEEMEAVMEEGGSDEMKPFVKTLSVGVEADREREIKKQHFFLFFLFFCWVFSVWR